MTDKLKTHETHPEYDPPQALRLGSTHTGEGGIAPTCTVPGSGAVGDCGSGAGATGWCYTAGNTATLSCDVPGNTAGEGCSDGNSATAACGVGNGLFG